MAPSLPHAADDGGDQRSSTKPRVKIFILCNGDAKGRVAGAASAGTTGETPGSRSGRIMQIADEIAHRLRANDYGVAGVPRSSSIDATTTTTTRPEAAAASVEVSIRIMVGGGGERLLSLLRQQEERIGGDDPTVFGILSACGGDVATAKEDRWAAGVVETLSAHSPWPYVVLPAGGGTTSDEDGAGDAATDAALRLARLCGLVDPLVRSAVSTELRRRREETLVADATVKTTSAYLPLIRARYDSGTQITGDRVYRDGDLPAGMRRIRGKVRDRYEVVVDDDDEKNDSELPIALVTTDRQSGFDRMLALVPYKGQVLNLTSAYWFEQTRHLVPNHLLAVPHPNVSIVRRCRPFPIEFVVRAYMTGSTSTSIWKNYQDGVRRYCGHDLPDGMIKNQKLARVIVTPTTKEEDHDRPISAEDIVSEGWMTQGDFDICSAAALRLFEFGQRVAAERGLILVDTKYEMGRDLSSGGGCSGDIMVIDEMHTPDSSRYWLASSYEQRMAAGLEPENIDKEFLRLWFRDNCDPYVDDVLPEAPRDLVCELSRRYISLYEMITWREFEFDDAAETEIADVVATFLKQPIT